VGFCEHGNETLGSVKYAELFDLSRNCWLLKKYSGLWSYLFQTVRFILNIQEVSDCRYFLLLYIHLFILVLGLGAASSACMTESRSTLIIYKFCSKNSDFK